jgi:hypothetical protein
VETGPGGLCRVYDASLIELIARPERFDGKMIQVIGYVRLEFEGNGIYLSREASEHGITRNGLWIEPPDSIRPGAEPPPRYMTVRGTFNAANHGGMWNGAIEHVTRFDVRDLEAAARGTDPDAP